MRVVLYYLEYLEITKYSWALGFVAAVIRKILTKYYHYESFKGFGMFRNRNYVCLFSFY